MLSSDGDEWYDNYLVYDEDEGSEEVNLDVISCPLSKGDNNITLKLTDSNKTPISNVGLAILTGQDLKINKVTTDSKGIAVYNVPSTIKNFSFVAGFWKDKTHLTNSANYNNKKISCWFYSSDNAFWGDIYQKEYDGDDNGIMYADLGFTDSLKNSNGNLTFMLTDSESNAPIANVDLAILTNDYKITKLTTNSKGIAVYDVPFGNDFDFAVGFWCDENHISDYTNFNGNILKTWFSYSDDEPIKTQSNTSGESLSNYGGNFYELNNLIENAKNGSIISLNKDYIGSGEIKINKSLTINGNNHIIDASSKSRIFTIESLSNGPVTLNNIQFRNAFASEDNGGAIYVYGNELTINNCKFINNRADKDGGAIYLERPTASLKTTNLNNVIFENNSADVGGAVYSEQKLTVVDCDFDKNHASSYGGAIYTYNGQKGILSTGYFVGGVLVGETSSFFKFSLNISGKSTFRNNNAGKNGGAVAIGATNSILEGFYGSLTLNKGVIFENNAAKYGGALYLRAVESNITNVIFNNNRADKYGGAIYSFNLSELNLSNSVFKDNIENSAAGSIFGEYKVRIVGSQFTGSNDVEFICYENYEVVTGSEIEVYGDFYENNNKMNGKAPYDIYYKGYSLLEFKTKLVFKDLTVSQGDVANLVELQDANGNSIRVNSINLLITNKAGASVINVSLSYNPTTKGYSYNTKGLKVGTYSLTGSASLAKNCEVVAGALKVSDIKLSAKDLSKFYGGSEKFTVTLTKGKNPLSKVNVKITVNGKTSTVKTDSKGKATLAISNAPGTYNATVTYAGLQTTAKIVVKKATPKITASSKTFKVSVKTKQYTITLKVNNKVMKSTKVTLNVNGKTYSATTNVKGQATFKINKLTKKGTFNAVIKYACNKYYNAASKTVKITTK